MFCGHSTDILQSAVQQFNGFCNGNLRNLSDLCKLFVTCTLSFKHVIIIGQNDLRPIPLELKTRLLRCKDDIRPMLLLRVIFGLIEVKMLTSAAFV